MTEPAVVLRVLNGAGVEYVLIGGVAATLHGSARFTADVDILYRRSRDNIERLVAALAPHSPYLRGAPPGLPFTWDVETVRRGLNFTLTTNLGPVDVLGEVVGGGRYEDVSSRCVSIEAFGQKVPVVALDALIEMKRATGRPKDFEALAELEAIAEEQKKS